MMSDTPRKFRSRVDRLLALAGLLIVAAAVGVRAEPAVCQDAQLGHLLVVADGLRVVEPASPGLHAGDTLLQLNSHRLRSCSDLHMALAEAAAEDLARLVLVRRAEGTSAVVVREPAAAVATNTVPPARVAAPTPVPVVLKPSDVGPVREMLTKLLRFGHQLQRSLPILSAQPWTRQVADQRRAYDRRHPSVPALAVVEPILSDYQTVVDILAYKENAERAAGYVRPRPNVRVEYGSASPVSTWLRRYPFLRASVVRPAERFTFIAPGERSGLWSPDHAVRLLVERALKDGDALARQLESTQPR